MKKTILTVDDSKSVRQMVGFVLKEAGFDIIEAEDGQDAVNKLGSANVDMMITDINMPNMDGIELIRWVRNDTTHKFLPVVMLTTESQESKKQEGKAAGATGWIIKPFNPDQLLSVIKMVLR